MQYLLLICLNEDVTLNLPAPVVAQRHASWNAYADELVAAGKMRGGARLRPAAAATTVREQGGRQLISDGPFAETKEQLGGYFLIEAANLDEAVAWAGKMPHLQDGGAVEVRPIWEMGEE